MKLKTVVEVFASTVTALAAVCGGLWALHEYNAKQASDRVQVTLDYRRRYDSDRILGARELIEQTWFTNRNKIRKIVGQQDWQNFRTFIVALNYEPKYRTSVLIVVDFYSELFVCLRDEICDRRTTLDLFGNDAKAYWNDNEPYFLHQRRQRNDNFACGMNLIAKFWADRERTRTGKEFDIAGPEISSDECS